MRRRLVFVLAVSGCAYDAKGQGSGPGSGSESSGPEGGDTTTGQGGSSTTVVLEGSSSGGSSSGGSSSSSSEGTGSSTTTSPDPDTGTTTEPLPTARSCMEILEEEPSSPTGVYPILSTSNGAAVDVHCEMELDGGGWTLVARSAPGPGVPFGWGITTGTLGNEDEPYSLDAMGLGLPFGEILITRREGFATPVARAYVVEVPDGFLEDYRDEAYDSEEARTVLGNCAPPSGPDMLRWWGYTDDETHYFFRDLSGTEQWGLFPDELRAYYDDCNRGGWLHEEQGALFVR